MSNQGDGRSQQGNDNGYGNAEGQQPWSGGQQPWTGGQQPWSSGGQPPPLPSWSTGETGPNVGPTMNNPQSSYYARFSAASGEGVVVPPMGGGGGGRGKVLLGAAAALVVVIAAVAVVALTRGGSKAPATAANSSTSSLPPVTATTWLNPTLAAGARALKSGWQSQQANDGRGIFDVPKTADWTLGTSDTFFGYADNNGKPLVISKAPVEFGVGYCAAEKTADTAWLGLMNVGKRDPSDAGPDLAQKFADAIALKKDNTHAREGKLSAPAQIKVNQGTLPALQYTMTAVAGEPEGCDAGKTYEVRTVTFSAAGKSYQLVSIRMLGAPAGKQLSAGLLDEIITTFRPQ